MTRAPSLNPIFDNPLGNDAPASSLSVVADDPQRMVETLQKASFEGLFQVIIADLEEDHAEFFQRNAGPDGTPWALLKQSTIDAKKHDTILRDKGRLWGSVAADDPPYAIRLTFDEQLTKGLVFGTDAPYAKFHQDGTAKIPARPFFGWTEERKDRVTEMVLDHVAAILSGSVDAEGGE